MTSREKFEAWVKFHLDDKFTEVPLYRGNGGLNYLDSQVDLAWIAWQAAETDMEVQLANAESKCRELAEFKSRVYAQMGAGCEAPEFAITEGLNNLHRFADTLHAIEREFFTKEVPDEECEGETVEECPLCWGMTVEQYVSEFGKCLAEVRAQVWIEGNEPAEFGRYWVRYETDVGPQYCSAKWMEHNFCAGSNTNIHKIWLADHSRSINTLRGVTHYTRLPDSLEGAAQ
ncbi:hypothetical protein [Citrobacter braakii]|uniref:hypothetical protein n=1 Tax=Citrobacter braakii TaxID=57706 RepID=UPI000A9BF2CB|nr:hypothetical protein [Citrobacter braakii]